MRGGGRVTAIASCIALASCTSQPVERYRARPLPETPEQAPTAGREPIEPLPERVPVDRARAAIGERLFSDVRLSGDSSVSCATCHPLDAAHYGTDGRVHSVGVAGAETAVNTPSIYDVAFDAKLNWTGRFSSFETHHDALIANARAMASSWPVVVGRVQSDPEYARVFSAAYPRDGVTAETVRDALVAFERTLVTPNAPFDRFLRGDTSALSADAREGWTLFKGYGCVSCHQGINVGGNMVQRFGVMRRAFDVDPTRVSESDYGRFNVTHEEGDRFVFRVPSLRNVARTAPYFHNGSAATLEDAVRVMADVQLGRALDAEETRKIVAFLGSLTGELPAR